MPSGRQLLIDLSVMLGLGLLLALIGPFGSFQAPFAWRLAYWLTLALSGYALYQPICAIATIWAPRLELPEAALWVGACLISSIPMAAIVWIVGYLPRPVPWPSLSAAVTVYGYVLTIGGAVTLLFYLLNRDKLRARPKADVDGADEPEAPARARFLDRLPPRLGTELIALEMEDHYVRAHTPLGSELILMRMRDAVAELDGMAGAQVHRSWWVARAAVTGVTRDGRNVRLRLTGDLEAPVSRANAPVLEAAGWW